MAMKVKIRTKKSEKQKLLISLMRFWTMGSTTVMILEEVLRLDVSPSLLKF